MKSSAKRITVALAGNPNSGKTTIFNNITGYRQHVGNYPGVTVEKKEGKCRYRDYEMNVVDLPGTYSLTAYSIEEIVARDFVLDDKPDVVVDIIDCSNLERNLYLATQIIDLGAPLILAFNMSDMAEARGIEFDLERLSDLLGAPIVSMVGSKGKGTEELLRAIVEMAEGRTSQAHVTVNYGREIEEELAKIQELVRNEEILADEYDSRWVAIKLLENDPVILKKVDSSTVLDAVARSIAHLQKVFGDHPEIILADRRYGFISGACQEAVRVSVESRHNMSDKIDSVITNRVLGLPIFLVLMYLAFDLTFRLGAKPMEWIEFFFGWFAGFISGWWPAGSESALRSLLVDGVIGGVGGVIIFLPNILLLFLAIAILEDTGYMARAAFIMDRLMHKIGLHGKSFIPLVIGFGCTVPAIMATRILDTRRDRLTTMLVAPLMSCSARLAIYSLIIPAFFPQTWRAPMLWIIYLIGIMLAIGSAKLLRATVLRGESTPLVMELPPYRIPTFKGVIIHMWERGSEYLKKAGTVILAISIVLWFLTTYPRKEGLDQTSQALLSKAEVALKEGIVEAGIFLFTGEDSAMAVKGVEAFTTAIGAELAAAEEQEEYRKRDPRFGAIENRTRTTIRELVEADSAGLLRRFLFARDEIESARNAFVETIEDQEIEEGTREYKRFEEELHATLARMEESDKRVYEASIIYLDSVKAPFKARIEEIEDQERKDRLSYSTAGRIGSALEPLIKPMGFDWRIGTAMIGAFAAKEVFVAQMGIVFSVGEADEESDALRKLLKETYTPLIAFCIMLFSLISAPCLATIAITRKESRSWGWALFQLGGLTLLAYTITALVYQIGTLLGIGTTMLG